MICLCANCQPDEMWLDGSVNSGGVLTFYDPDGDGHPLKIERGSCSAFSVETLEHMDDHAGRSSSVTLRYVPIQNILVGDTDADGCARVPLSDIYTDPITVIRRLAGRGFYFSPSATPDEIVQRIRWAVDCHVFEARRKHGVPKCSEAA